MTPPQNPAAFEPAAGRPGDTGARRRAEMQGSLYGEPDRPARPGPMPPAAPNPAPPNPAPPNPAAPNPVAPRAVPPRPPRFDLRAEFAALAAEPDPFALQQRSERLADRFDHEQRNSASRGESPGQHPRGRPVTGQTRFESPSGLAGELGHAAEPAGPAVPETRGRTVPPDPGLSGPGLAGELPLTGDEPVANPPSRPESDPGAGMGTPPLIRPDPGAGQFAGSLAPSGPGGPPPGPRVPQGPRGVSEPPPIPPEARWGEPPVSPPLGVPRVSNGMPPGPGAPPSAPQGPRGVSEPLPVPPEARRNEPPVSPPLGVPRVPDGMPPGPGAPPPGPVSPPFGIPRAPEGPRGAPPAPHRAPGMPGPSPQGVPPGAPPVLGSVQTPIGPPPSPQRRGQVAPPPPQSPQPPSPGRPPRPQPLPTQPPATQQPKPEPARPARPQGRADGGFGPVGSGNWSGTSSRAGYQGRAQGFSSGPEDDLEEQEHRNVPQLHTGSRHRPGEIDDGQSPQFLVEDDLYDDEFGESRLVAPPVLGEAPASFRDF